MDSHLYTALGACFGARARAFLLALALVIFCASPCVREAAAAGNYQRIASLAPGITETVFALGLGDRLVGVTQYCDWPPEARNIDKVGGFREINLEAIIRAKPDLVLLPDDMAHYKVLIEEVGIPVMLIDNRTLPGYLRDVEELGRLLGSSANAEKLVSGFRRVMAQNRPGESAPRILFALMNGDECARPIAEITVLGAGGFYDDLLEAAGGQNAYAGKVPYPRLSGEAIFALEPDIVAIAAMECPNPDLTLANWRKLPGLAAKKTEFLVLQDKGDTIPGPRSLQTLEKLANAVKDLSASTTGEERIDAGN